MRNLNSRFTVVSLFAGAGGLDMGFENSGFKVIWANDIDKDACETHRSWSDATVVQGDIAKLDLNEIPFSDVITGGFPCQGFSLAGPRKINDERNSLYKHFVKLVELKKPKVFVAENVKGILTLGKGTIIDAIVEDFSRREYRVFYKLLNAADYGVPQDRWRVILVGIRKDLPITEFCFPLPHNNRTSLREVLFDFPDPSPNDLLHDGYSSRYMSRNRRRDWDDVSYTIPAMAKQVTLHPSSPNMIKIHEDKWIFGDGKSRRFTWREAAVIQTFPKSIDFRGDVVSKFKQIGNAVPVKLAESIALEVKRILDNATNE